MKQLSLLWGAKADSDGATMRLSSFMKAFTAAILLLACNLGFSFAQSPASPSVATTVLAPANWRAQRAALENQFGAELQEIGDWCRANGIPQQVEQTFKLYVNRDLGRQYIFLPDERCAPVAPDGAPEILKQWFSKVSEAKSRHADRIFALAKKAANQDAGGVAFQYLYDVIHYNRDHPDVRRMLGHRKTDDGWKVASDSLRIRNQTRDHDIVNWPGGSYIKVLTPHFEIESNASEERTRVLAEKLERWHLVWRQVFFEYWSSPKTVKRWMDGKGSLTMSKRRFRVVFFKDHADYINQLTPLVRGIAVSTGYYSNDQRVSFFSDGGRKAQETWCHELTHQLFRESGGANGDNLEQQFIWLDEGIATYFESVNEFNGYVTIGGFEASRLQFARIRKLLEKFHIPIAELSSLGRAQLQQRGDIERIYSEAAGLTDMLMNDSAGAYEQPLIEFLTLIYKGKVKPGKFEKLIGKKFAELDARYHDYLFVESETVERRLEKPESLTELSLPGAKLRTLAFESIGQCVNLNWLDLSRNGITLDQFEELANCKKINQLILTECRFQSNSLRGLELFPALDDVDLSGSSVQDAQLVSFRNLKALKSLQLTATAITDQGLMHLAAVPQLQSVNVARTRVTPAGIANLQARRPGLRITR